MKNINNRAKQLEDYGKAQILKHGFLFIDIPRTSSTSIRVELGEAFGAPYAKKNTLNKHYSKPQIFRDHVPAKFMKQIIGEEAWNQLFVFTIVRNPWDRILSLYNYRTKNKNIPDDMTFKEYVCAIQQWVTGKGSDFSKNLTLREFLNLDGLSIHDGFLFNYAPFYLSCSGYIFDDNDNQLVDYVCKYENRQNDLKMVADKIGFPQLGKLHTQETSGSSLNYAEFYDAETRDIIAGLYSDDISNFEYHFEDK